MERLKSKKYSPDNILIDSENGFFVNYETVLATKIIQILENDDVRITMSAKSHEMASKFNWEKVVKKMLVEYEDVQY